MDTQDRNVSQRHHRAAALFLGGQFREAEALWHDLLAHDPADQRAREGARLCHVLEEQQRHIANQQVANSLEQKMSIDNELAQLDVAIDDASVANLPVTAFADTQVFDPAQVSAVAGAQSPGSPQPQGAGPRQADDSLRDAIDELPTFFQSPTGTSSRPTGRPAYPTGSHLQPDMDDETAEAATRAAEVELRRRIHELMSQARAAATAADHETAVGLVKRVLILDEANVEAADLMFELTGERPELPGIGAAMDATDIPLAGVPLAGPSDSMGDPGGDLLGDVDLSSLDQEALDGQPLAPGALDAPHDSPLGDMPLGDAPLGDAPLGDAPLGDAPLGDAPLGDAPLSDDGMSEGLDESLDEELDDDRHEALQRAEERLSRLREGKSGGNKKMILIAAAAVAGLVVLGFGAMSLMGGGGNDASEGPDPLAEAMKRKQAAEKKARLAEQAAAAAAAAAPGVDQEVVDGWLSDAEAKFEARELTAAIELFRKVIEERPENEGAIQGLADATELLRRDQERNSARDEAFERFRAGDYRDALRRFYRLPKNEGVDYTPYIAAGWYNLGVLALQRSDCSGAAEPFGEYLSMVGASGYQDPAVELSGLCDGQAGSIEFRRAAERLALRTLE